MGLRSGRKLPKSPVAHLPAQGRLAHRRAERLPEPLHKIDQPPAQPPRERASARPRPLAPAPRAARRSAWASCPAPSARSEPPVPRR
jgi:hypothetical protein